MKKIVLLSTFCLLIAMYSWAQTPTPINQVRPLPPGTVVTVQGMLTADRATMRWTGYMQDETGGISFYDAASNHQLDSLKPGDIFIITGTLKDYNALLEISPVSSVTLISSNNPLPTPVVVPVDQIDDSYESMLVKLENVHFDASVQGQFFSSSTSGINYNITDLDGNTTQVRILPSTNIVGTLIPIGNINITGCMSQYSPSNPNAGYQLIPRSVNDINNFEVTFNVDMHGVGLNAGENVYISGDFGGIYGYWDEPGTNMNNLMTDVDNDSIYSITMDILAGLYHYKYFKGNGWSGGEWTGDPNRTIIVNGDISTTVKWGKKPFNLTLNVDMHGAGLVTDEVVYLASNFGGSYGIWDEPGTNPANILTDADADSIYTITVSLDSIGTYEFKFFKGIGWSGGEWTGDPNRIIAITGNTTANFLWGIIGNTGYNVNGTLTYANSANTPMYGVTLNLKNEIGNTIGTIITDAFGNYNFVGISNGNYTLEPTTNKSWGGVTAGDVLLYKKHIASIISLSGIYFASGDVNASGSLTASDILLIKKRIASIISSFPSGDWLFNNGAINVNGSNVMYNFNGLVYGDANGSYIPTAVDLSAVKKQGIISMEEVSDVKGAK